MNKLDILFKFFKNPN